MNTCSRLRSSRARECIIQRYKEKSELNRGSRYELEVKNQREHGKTIEFKEQILTNKLQ